MKKIKNIFGLAACVLLMAACAQDVPEDAFGNTTVPDNPLMSYMTTIADSFVCDNLRELESALSASESGGLGKYFYENNGKALTEDGAVWTVKKESNLRGLKIEKVSGAWKLSYSGKYAFSGNPEYETSITIIAEQADPAATGHQSWNLIIDGTRTEENGYSCTFSSVDMPVRYKMIGGDNLLWNAFGYIMMTVYKNDTQVDKVVMELAGGKSDSSKVRI